MEKWLPVVGFEMLYEVSSKGRVRKCTGRILKASPDSRGYPKVWLIKDGKGYCPKVHRMVAGAFIGRWPKGCETNHKDGVKTNNDDTNLEYITHQQNVQHAFEHRMYLYGTQRRGTVLTEDLVHKARQEWKPRTRGYGVVILARKYGVNIKTLQTALRGKTWSHVPPAPHLKSKGATQV